MATMTADRHADRHAGWDGRDSFGRLVLAEWTKLRSVPRWAMAMLAAVVLTVLVSVLAASDNSYRGLGPPIGPDGRGVTDEFYFVHQPLTGDGGITAKVLSQTGVQGESHEWAKAGVLIKESTKPGSQYAAMIITPGHGVRLQSNFTTDRAGSQAATAPRWLRLTRSGTSVTGYESADGANWTQVGTVQLPSLPRRVEVGLFVASPFAIKVERQFGRGSVGASPTSSTARFSDVVVTAAQPGRPAPWSDQAIGGSDRVPESLLGSATQAGGVFTVTGSGDVAPLAAEQEVDGVRQSLTGVSVGVMVIVAVAVLFITSEYRQGMIRTTFAASPRRGRVLAAKAIVVGATTFVVGLLASLASVLLALPILRANGLAPPVFQVPSLSDGPVLRAIVGTAAVLALFAVLGLAAGAILRRSPGAIIVVVVPLLIPQLIAGALPLAAARWLMLATPAAGFSIQQTIEQRYDFVSSICLPEEGCFTTGPWVGFGVLCAYTAVALAAGFWLLRRRDA
jgi:regulation of enolase protein 1 (concanavalin A-like superfamily)/ABC-type transport system involved in multi-copper enzyme maturation permease subunit